ncbi:MAG: hypothetical protein Q4P78_09345, partial [Rothia sp. (in: high G+C Gram-positive bacteria)]|uniref:hypothetical protein n=1 Tax=Rothia sp. (in: high G+C Gram-positive bacteria) TaxID=1885016 RepID=UPI0026DF62FD
SMSYRFARAFHTDVCLTVVNIDAPSTLAGTEVAITEHRAAQQLVTPIITTFIPTMQEPKTITGRNVYECLPLTDIGYLDLMAYPSATGVKAATPPSGWQPLTTATQVRTIAGPGSIFIVEELVDSEAYSWGVGEYDSEDGVDGGGEGCVRAAVVGVEDAPGL